MDVEARAPGQPCPDLGSVVGGVVVAHQVHVKVRGYGLVDRGQELLEFDGAVAAVQFADDRAVGDVEGGEQAGDAVPQVVVGAPLGHARHHRQHRLGPVQCIWLFSSTHSTTALSGGSWYSPT